MSGNRRVLIVTNPATGKMAVVHGINEAGMVACTGSSPNGFTDFQSVGPESVTTEMQLEFLCKHIACRRVFAKLGLVCEDCLQVAIFNPCEHCADHIEELDVEIEIAWEPWYCARCGNFNSGELDECICGTSRGE